MHAELGFRVMRRCGNGRVFGVVTVLPLGAMGCSDVSNDAQSPSTSTARPPCDHRHVDTAGLWCASKSLNLMVRRIAVVPVGGLTVASCSARRRRRVETPDASISAIKQSASFSVNDSSKTPNGWLGATLMRTMILSSLAKDGNPLSPER
jgi:hypothetical protein